MNVNNQIRAPQIRVIDPNGTQVGIMDVRRALELAQETDLDLVEVSPNAKPPVCRIMDYGKFKYEQSKREKKKKQQTSQLKEIWLRPMTDKHDYQFKLRHAENFLKHHDKLKIKIRFRGRESAHKELGQELLKRISEDLSHLAAIEGPVRFEGRNMVMMLVPK